MSVALETHSQVHLTRATQWGVHPLNPAPPGRHGATRRPEDSGSGSRSRRVA